MNDLEHFRLMIGTIAKKCQKDQIKWQIKEKIK